MQPESLTASGADMVYAQAVYAIVGALALEKGGAVANEVAKEKVLDVLGMSAEEAGGTWESRMRL
jgi:large subunit ribosomal protein L15